MRGIILPSSAEHAVKVCRNTETMQLISANSSYDEWVAVTAFYTTIHIIEQYFSDYQVPIVSPEFRNLGEPNNHRERRETLHLLMQKGKIPQKLRSKYRLLANAANIARYESMDEFNRQFATRIQELLEIVAEFRKTLP